MAHTLQIFDSQSSTTEIDFAANPASSSTGIFLIAYDEGAVNYDVTSVSSLYGDGASPVFERSGNVIDTITVSIVGSSRDDAISRLQSIERALFNARQYGVPRGGLTRKELRWKPDGTTTSVTALIKGGRVIAGTALTSTELVSNFITPVIIVIERTIWSSIALVTLADLFATVPFGKVAVSATVGDIPGLFLLQGITTLYSTSHTIIVSLSPQSIYGGAYNLLGIQERTGTADGTASGGSYEAIALSGTPATGAIGNFVMIVGPVRVWMRAKLSAAGTASITLRWLTYAGTTVVQACKSVSITGTSWQMVDLGAINFVYSTSNAVTLGVSMVATSGTPTIHIDCYHIMPAAQGYTLRADALIDTTFGGTLGFQWSNINWCIQQAVNGAGILQATNANGTLYAPTSPYYLHWLTFKTSGNSNAITDTLSTSLYVTPRYLTARGA